MYSLRRIKLKQVARATAPTKSLRRGHATSLSTESELVLEYWSNSALVDDTEEQLSDKSNFVRHFFASATIIFTRCVLVAHYHT